MLPADQTPSQPTICHVCKRVAVEGAVFEAAVHEGKRQGICPECRALRDRNEGFRNLKLFLFLAGLMGVMIVARGDNSASTWNLFNVCVGVLMLYFVAVPAKLVHALVSRLLGWAHGSIEVGHGRPLIYAKFAGWALVWRAIPLGAVLAPGHPVRPSTLGRELADVAVEPITHLLMAAIAWLVMGVPGVDFRAFSHRLDIGWLFIAANLYHFFLVAAFLFPAGIKSYSRPVPRPVAGAVAHWPARIYPAVLAAAILLLIPLFASFYRNGSEAIVSWVWFYGFMACCGLAGWLSTARHQKPGDQAPTGRFGSVFQQVHFAAGAEVAQEIERTRGQQDEHPVHAFARTDSPEAATAIIDSFRAAHPDSFLTAYMLYFKCSREDDWPGAQAVLEGGLCTPLPPHLHAQLFCSWADAAVRSGSLDPAALRERLAAFTSPPFSPLVRCVVLASSAHFLLAVGRPDSLTEVGRWADEAMYLAPGDTAVSCTAGGILIEAGDLSAGESVLSDVLARSPEMENRGMAFLFLAIAARRRREHRSAGVLARRASVMLPNTSLFAARWQREMGQTS